MSAVAGHPRRCRRSPRIREVLAAIAANPSAFASFASNANAFRDAASNAAADARMASNAAAFEAARDATTRRCRRSQADPRGVQRARRQCGIVQGAFGPAAGALRSGQQRGVRGSSAAIGRHIERGDVGARGKSVGVRLARRATAGTARRSPATRRRLRRSPGTRRRWPRSCPMHRRSAASRSNANAFQQCCVESGSGRAHGEQRFGVPAARQRQECDVARSPPIRRSSRRSAIMRSPSPDSPATRIMMSPQLIVGDRASNASAFSTLPAMRRRSAQASQALQALTPSRSSPRRRRPGRSTPARRRRCLPTRRHSRR